MEKLNQLNNKKEFVPEISLFIPEEELQKKYFNNILDEEGEDPNRSKLRTQYEEKETLWIVSYLNIIKTDMLSSFIFNYDKQALIDLKNITSKIFEWMFNSGWLNTFVEEKQSKWLDTISTNNEIFNVIHNETEEKSYLEDSTSIIFKQIITENSQIDITKLIILTKDLGEKHVFKDLSPCNDYFVRLLVKKIAILKQVLKEKYLINKNVLFHQEEQEIKEYALQLLDLSMIQFLIKKDLGYKNLGFQFNHFLDIMFSYTEKRNQQTNILLNKLYFNYLSILKNSLGDDFLKENKIDDNTIKFYNIDWGYNIKDIIESYLPDIKCTRVEQSSYECIFKSRFSYILKNQEYVGIIQKSQLLKELKLNESIELSCFSTFNNIIILETKKNLDSIYNIIDKIHFTKLKYETKYNGYVMEIISNSQDQTHIYGYKLNIQGNICFLPRPESLMRDLKLHEEIEVLLTESNSYGNTVSHKALIESDLAIQKMDIMSKLEKGQVLEGTVKNITSYGVFVDLGGVDGLIHVTDLTWGRVSDIEDIVSEGESIKVVILKFDEAKSRIQLGLKQLGPHPWDNLDENLKVGDEIEGKVVVVADYGVFVELQRGVEALLHVSEMSWSRHLRSANDFYKKGDVLKAKILTLDKETRKMSLGVKHLTPDPWTDIADNFSVGSKHIVKARNFTDFGIFVELVEGIDGLVHISDLSWTKKIKHPSEFTQIGEEIEVIILDINKKERHISLGHKQLTDQDEKKLSKSAEETNESVPTKQEYLLKKGAKINSLDDLKNIIK